MARFLTRENPACLRNVEQLEARLCLSTIGFTPHPLLQGETFGLATVRAADINGDGDADVVYIDQDGTMGWYRGTDAGARFDGPFRLPKMPPATSLKLRDVDADGDVDIVTFGSSGVWIRHNSDGKGTFPSRLRIDEAEPERLVLEDFDGDGDLDVFVDSEDSVPAWFENVEGQFGSPKLLDDEPSKLALGDVDADGDLDVILIDGNHVYWRENLDDSAEIDEKKILSRRSPCDMCVFADMNGDAAVDLISWSSRGMAWFENRLDRNERRGFHSEATTITAATYRPSEAIDFDGDEDNDLIVATDSDVFWIENLGSGIFGTPRTAASIGRSDLRNVVRSTDAFDMDGDGQLEIVASHFRRELIAWHDVRDDQTTTLHPISTSRIHALDVGDLNGNGSQDLLVGFGAGVIWYANEASTSSLGVPSVLSERHATQVMAVDMDQDGDLDVYAGFNDGHRAWFENLDGVGTFSEPLTTLDFVAFGDLDGDGDVDGVSVAALRFFWHETEQDEIGTGRVHPLEIAIVPGDSDRRAMAPDISLADLDGDGDLDLVSTPPLWADVVWHENLDGKGNFGTSREIGGGLALTKAVITDLDEDGDKDVLVHTIDGFGGHNLLYSNVDGKGTFARSQVLPSEYGVLLSADVDSDGRNDLVSGVSNIALLIQHDDGFEPQRIEDKGAKEILLEDLDDDGDIDVLALHHNNRVTWYESDLANPSNAIPGDSNLDNQVNFADFIVLANNFGRDAAEWSEGDFNGDQRVTFEDFVILVQNFGDHGE